MSDADAGVTREEVLWCFQNLLGRSLENENAIDHFLRTEHDFRSLVNTIVFSHEFQNNLALSKRPGLNRDGFNYNDSLNTQDVALEVLQLLSPKCAQGFKKRRVGNAGDGGYVMLDDFVGIQAAYSLGINTDVTWDREVASLGIDVYQYDHTIDSLPEENARFHWFKKGIAAIKNGSYDTLPNLMRENGHSDSRDLLLKCDIEGHEWEMLESMPPECLLQFRQIVLETHGWNHLDVSKFADRVKAGIRALSSGHSMIHVHANNCASYAIVGGIPVGAVMEMTFVRSDSYKLSESDELFPTSLDAPCDPNRADFVLGNFKFPNIVS